MTLRVLYLTGFSSENELSKPIIRRMENDPYFDVEVWNVLKQPPHEKPWDSGFCESVLKANVVVSPCDRVEVLHPTIDAFFSNKIIVRIYAGIQTSGGTHDDVIRRMLDSMGHVLLCESEECRQNLIRQGEEEWRIPPPFGLTHLDDVELVPPKGPYWQPPYAVFVMNPTTISEERTKTEMVDAMDVAIKLSKKMFVVCFPPNGDMYSEVINTGVGDLEAHYPHFHVYKERIPRNEFLFYLSRADVFISNSSAAKYEYPALNPKGEVYNPSWRNAERTKPPPLEKGGSDRIIKVLKEVKWDDPNLLRKRFRF